MIHQQEKMELMTQQIELANTMIENKLMSREWIYDNIFELNQHEKKEMFEGIIEDRKQQFRMEQIETEGNDPAESGAAADDMEEPTEEQSGEHGGDRRSGTAEKEYGNEYDAEDLKDATKYERQRYGKRSFKHGSPLHPGKGSTIVASENLLNQLKAKFGGTNNNSILNEDILIDDEVNS